MLQAAADHWNYREDDTGYFAQPGKLFRLMSPAQQEALFGNTARALGDVPKEVKIRHIELPEGRPRLWQRDGEGFENTNEGREIAEGIFFRKKVARPQGRTTFFNGT